MIMITAVGTVFNDANLSNVNANDVALAADLNQYKEALEGTRDFSPLLKAASSQDFYIRMSNTGGGQFFKVQNSSSVDALVVNSNGVVTPTTLQITGLAAPADATAGRMSYDTNDPSDGRRKQGRVYRLQPAVKQ